MSPNHLTSEIKAKNDYIRCTKPYYKRDTENLYYHTNKYQGVFLKVFKALLTKHNYVKCSCQYKLLQYTLPVNKIQL
jgi:hypothetical protein